MVRAGLVVVLRGLLLKQLEFESSVVIATPQRVFILGGGRHAAVLLQCRSGPDAGANGGPATKPG
jgi:hypothetical protein